MDWKSLIPTVLLSKPLALLVAIFAAILLIVPTLIIWAYGYMTAALFFAICLLGLFALSKWELLDIKEKYPWLVFLPFAAFFVGVIVEKGRIFQLQPTLSLKLFSLSILDQMISITLGSVLLLCIAILLIIGLAKRT